MIKCSQSSGWTPPYFNPTEVIIQSFLEKLKQSYMTTYGGYKPHIGETIH